MFTRRELWKPLTLLGCAGATGINILQQPRERPERLEPGQIWRHKPGVNVIVMIGRAYDVDHELAEFWPDWDEGRGVLLTGEDCGASDEDILRSFDYVCSIRDLRGQP